MAPSFHLMLGSLGDGTIHELLETDAFPHQSEIRVIPQPTRIDAKEMVNIILAWQFFLCA